MYGGKWAYVARIRWKRHTAVSIEDRTRYVFFVFVFLVKNDVKNVFFIPGIPNWNEGINRNGRKIRRMFGRFKRIYRRQSVAVEVRFSLNFLIDDSVEYLFGFWHFRKFESSDDDSEDSPTTPAKEP